MKKENVIAGIAIVGVAAIALYLMNKPIPNQTAGDVVIPGLADQPAPPVYMVYNFPKFPDLPFATLPNAGTGGNGGLPANGGTCGCASLPQSFYTSLSNLLNDYATAVTGFEQNYIDNIKSVFPTYVSQYFNNPEGAHLSATSQKYIQGV